MALRPIKAYSVSQQALDMQIAGVPLDEICEKFDKTRADVHSMISRARQQRAKRQAAE